MQITIETKPFATLETEALVTYIFEENDPIQGRVSEIDAAIQRPDNICTGFHFLSGGHPILKLKYYLIGIACRRFFHDFHAGSGSKMLATHRTIIRRKTHGGLFILKLFNS